MPETTRRAADREFAELICADPAWLDAEFDAIIAASFPPDRDEAPARGPSGPAGPPPAGHFADRPARPHPHAPFEARWMRQRSPPSPRCSWWSRR